MTEETQYADITPATDLIEGYRRQEVGFKRFAAELIDNAFDANASRFDLRWMPGGKAIRASDDGDGCDSIEAMFRLGRSKRHRSTRSGRYGVGLKVSAIWMGDTTKIDTVCNGKQLLSAVDWQEIERSGVWQIPIREGDGNARGTRITFSDLRQRLRKGLGGLADELSFLFWPALSSGKEIALSRKGEEITLSPWEPPPFEVTHREPFEVAGLPGRVTFGIVKEGHKNPKDGFLIVNSFRVIERTKQPAASLHLSTSRFCAIVELLEPGETRWPLSTLKDGLGEEIRDELLGALEEICGDVLREASEKSVEVGLGDLNRKVSEALGVLSGPKNQKAKRRKTDNPGTGRRKPTGSGSTHTRATRRQRGSTMRQEWRGLQYSLGDLEDRFADVDVESAVVTLDREHPAVRRLLETEDPTLIAQAVVREFAYHVFFPQRGKTLDMFGGLEARDEKVNSWLREVEEFFEGHAEAA